MATVMATAMAMAMGIRIAIRATTRAAAREKSAAENGNLQAFKSNKLRKRQDLRSAVFWHIAEVCTTWTGQAVFQVQDKH